MWVMDGSDLERTLCSDEHGDVLGHLIVDMLDTDIRGRNTRGRWKSAK
jgi:hypothetical protein